MTLQNKVIMWLLLLGAAFAAGFALEYFQLRAVERERQQVEAELQAAQSKIASLEFEVRLGGVRDLVSLMHVEVVDRNYGVAGKYSTQYFDRLREAADASPDPAMKSSLNELLENRDQLTSALAQGSGAALEQVKALLVQTHAITKADSQ